MCSTVEKEKKKKDIKVPKSIHLLADITAMGLVGNSSIYILK
jgi:hypothetical protein